MVRMRFKYSWFQDRWIPTACSRPEAFHRAMRACGWLVSFQAVHTSPKSSVHVYTRGSTWAALRRLNIQGQPVM